MKLVVEPPKKIFFGQAIFVAVMSGTFSFLNGYLDNKDFAVSSMNFSGFLLVSLFYKVFQLIEARKSNSRKTTKQIFFGNFVNPLNGRLNLAYTFQTLLRTAILLMFFWCLIVSINFANQANLNFGIISSCQYISIVANCIIGYFCFREIITNKQFLGIGVTLAGVIWISLSKSQPS